MADNDRTITQAQLKQFQTATSEMRRALGYRDSNFAVWRRRRVPFPGWCCPLFEVSSAKRTQLWLCLAATLALMMCVSSAIPEVQAGQQASQTFHDCSDCPEMVTVPAGRFLMGSSAMETTRDLAAILPPEEAGFARVSAANEHPQHLISINRSFALGKYLVTRGEFTTFVRETGYSISAGCTLWSNHKYPEQPEAGWQNPGFTQTDRDPVVCVNWQDAKAYIAWLNVKLHDRLPAGSNGLYRLPSESEWEYAARAGTRTARWWGDSIGSGSANCDGCGSFWDRKQPAPAGSFQTNPFGLADMLGNASEWMEDCWNESYAQAPDDGRAWIIGDCDLRVTRGGNWTNHPWVLRSALRSRSSSNRRGNYIGFRVARTLP